MEMDSVSHEKAGSCWESPPSPRMSLARCATTCTQRLLEGGTSAGTRYDMMGSPSNTAPPPPTPLGDAKVECYPFTPTRHKAEPQNHNNKLPGDIAIGAFC